MNREKLYWALIGLFAIGLVCLYIFWVHPIRTRVAAENARFENLSQRLKLPLTLQPKIPSPEVLDAHAAHRAWLASQLETQVKPFFASADASLDQRLVSESSRATPQRFKAAYIGRVAQMREQLSRSAPGLSLPGSVYPSYGWASGAGLPRPREFETVRKDFNVRTQFLELLVAHKASALRQLDVGTARMTQEDWSLIPVTLGVTLPAEQVTLFLRDLLQVDWLRGSDTRQLCVLVDHLSLDRAQSAGRVDVDLRLSVVDFPDALRAHAVEEGAE